MSTARQTIRSLAKLEEAADWAEVIRLHEVLRATIPCPSDTVTGFFAFAELVAELASIQSDDPHIRHTFVWAFALAVIERLDA